MRRRSSGQSPAAEGSRMSGRRIPHVSGMAGGWSHCSNRTGRAILRELDSSNAVCIQLSSSKGLPCANIHASRARPATSLVANNKKPAAQANSAQLAKLPARQDAAFVSTLVGGHVGEQAPAALARALPHGPDILT